MREVLKHWLDTVFDPPPTREAVVTALKSATVAKKKVADQLESKYCAPVHCMGDKSDLEIEIVHNVTDIAERQSPLISMYSIVSLYTIALWYSTFRIWYIQNSGASWSTILSNYFLHRLEAVAAEP